MYPCNIYRSSKNLTKIEEKESKHEHDGDGSTSVATRAHPTMANQDSGRETTDTTAEKSVTANDEFDFDVFVPIFIAIYKKYIESGNAPLELNLSGEERNNFKDIHDQIMVKKRSIDKDGISKWLNQTEFWYIWDCLCKATRTTFVLLYESSRQQYSPEI